MSRDVKNLCVCQSAEERNATRKELGGCVRHHMSDSAGTPVLESHQRADMPTAAPVDLSSPTVRAHSKDPKRRVILIS